MRSKEVQQQGHGTLLRRSAVWISRNEEIDSLREHAAVPWTLQMLELTVYTRLTCDERLTQV